MIQPTLLIAFSNSAKPQVLQQLVSSSGGYIDEETSLIKMICTKTPWQAVQIIHRWMDGMKNE